MQYWYTAAVRRRETQIKNPNYTNFKNFLKFTNVYQYFNMPNNLKKINLLCNSASSFIFLNLARNCAIM